MTIAYTDIANQTQLPRENTLKNTKKLTELTLVQTEHAKHKQKT